MSVIIVNDDGSVEFTRKPELLALFEDQTVSIKRMTEVAFDDERQRFYVEFKTGPHAGEKLDAYLVYRYQGYYRAGDIMWLANAVIETAVDDMVNVQNTVYFNTYEEGVRAELILVEAIRVATGASMHA